MSVLERVLSRLYTKSLFSWCQLLKGIVIPSPITHLSPLTKACRASGFSVVLPASVRTMIFAVSRFMTCGVAIASCGVECGAPTRFSPLHYCQNLLKNKHLTNG